MELIAQTVITAFDARVAIVTVVRVIARTSWLVLLTSLIFSTTRGNVFVIIKCVATVTGTATAI
eukprot:3869746-Lingulodinium_polyedra.AAC.1